MPCSKVCFEAVAAIIKREFVLPGILVLYEAGFRAAEQAALYFKNRNPRFDEGRFLEACGYPKQGGAHGLQV